MDRLNTNLVQKYICFGEWRGRETENKREKRKSSYKFIFYLFIRQRENHHLLIHSHKCLQQLELEGDQANIRKQEVNAGLPRVWQRPNNLSNHYHQESGVKSQTKILNSGTLIWDKSIPRNINCNNCYAKCLPKSYRL